MDGEGGGGFGPQPEAARPVLLRNQESAMSPTITNYDRMSPSVRAACLADDRQFQQAQLAEERQRAARAGHVDDMRLRAAVEMAEQRGEFVSAGEVARTGGACLGRTRGEMLAYVSAQQDAEDARARVLAGPSTEEIQQRHAALAAADPRVGRTKSEFLAYVSAVQDIQDIENARATALGKPAPSEQAAQRALLEKRREKIAALGRQQQMRTIAQSEISKDRARQLERQLIAGEITERQYLDGHRGLSA